MDNPLLTPTADSPLPAFDRILPEHAEPAIDAILADNKSKLAALLATVPTSPSAAWDALLEPLQDMGERLARAWGPVVHLFSVTSTADWRKAHNVCLPKVTQYHVDLSQNEALFRAYLGLETGTDIERWPLGRQKTIRNAVRDFKLSGVALPEEARTRFRDIAMRLPELEAKFQENVLDAVQAWSLDVPDESRLAGMTVQGRAAARAKARAHGSEGFRLTLDFPSYDAVISHADDRELRRQLYEAYATRASDQGPLAGSFDNGPLMEEILALRHEQARLLGFANYAELSLATKMAKSAQDVERFLLDLSGRARPRAELELSELKALARDRDGLTQLESWDLPYYVEKLRERQLGFSEDDLRPYFQAHEVISGMFALVQRLYGIQIDSAADVATWHPDVTTYVVRDAVGDRIGLFYLDPYARENKRGGAWMDECLGRRRNRVSAQDPACYLTGNFAPPLAGQPALLSHAEVLTLFHEFGHGLHHLLTRVDEPAVSGLRGVEWDAVELPSQFMENWCYDEDTLRTFARHWKTGDALPESLLAKLKASRTFATGLATLRQIEFALFDLRLHRDYDPDRKGSVLETLARTRREISLLHPPSYSRMPNSFAHIFGGGYAAGYYSYKWAEVLSADAFAAFEESGFARETSHRFRDSILAQGGSRDAMDLFVAFRGRKPSVDALLRQSGLAGS
jgi:oligopeptidase A